jgi:hypothetical protein
VTTAVVETQVHVMTTAQEEVGEMSPRSHPGNDPVPEGLVEKIKRGLDEEWDNQQADNQDDQDDQDD